MQNSTEIRKSDMSGPAKTCPGGQVLTANQRKYFYFFRNYTFPFCISKFIIFLIKSYVLLRECIIFYKIIGFTKRMYHFYKIICFIKRIYHFYKIICFTKQIYEYKSLSPNHAFTFQISGFTIFIVLFIIL